MKKVSSNTGQEPHFLQNYFLLNTFANMYAFQSYSCDLRVPVCDWLFSFIIAVESGQVCICASSAGPSALVVFSFLRAGISTCKVSYSEYLSQLAIFEYFLNL